MKPLTPHQAKVLRESTLPEDTIYDYEDDGSQVIKELIHLGFVVPRRIRTDVGEDVWEFVPTEAGLRALQIHKLING